MAQIVVAVDGPAGSGKSSVSKAVARRLGYHYQDTGAAYRALAWLALEEGIDREDEAAVVRLLDRFDYRIGLDPDHYFVTVGQQDVTEQIREPRVSEAVSSIARVPAVRAWMVQLFRDTIAESSAPGIITEGRDITTVVTPHADARILLTASAEARMGRRAAELIGQSAGDVAQALTARDTQDSRVVDFMNAAEGVTVIDSTTLDFDQTIQAVVDHIHQATLS